MALDLIFLDSDVSFDSTGDVLFVEAATVTIAAPLVATCGTLVLAGSTSEVVTAEAFSFSGTTPASTGTLYGAGYDSWLGFSGTTPQMEGEVVFVDPINFAVESPASLGLFEFGSEFSGKTPQQIGAFVVEGEESLSFVGLSPVMHGSFEFGAEFSGIIPAHTGSFALEYENWGEFSGNTPAMRGAFEIHQAMDFSGKTPSMQGAITGDFEHYGSFSGTTPAMLGSFQGTFWEPLDFSGRAPHMETAFVLGEDTIMDFSGETPPTIGIAPFMISVEATEDITQTSNGVIRYRRGYDNG